MSGVVSLVLMFAAIRWPDRHFIWPACLIAFVVSIFRVWRRAFHEARPYEVETFKHAEGIFIALSERQRKFLKDLSIVKSLQGFDGVWELADGPFVERHNTTGQLLISEDYKLIIPRLIKDHGI